MTLPIVNAFKLAGVSTILLLLVSCSTDEAPQSERGLLFSAKTKVTNSTEGYTNLQPGEEVGVYIVSKDEISSPAQKSSGIMYNNLQLICKREGILVPTTETFYAAGVSHVDFYAYAPYTETPAFDSKKSMLFTVEKKQSTEVDVRKSDLMLSKLLNVSTTATDTPALVFVHSLSKLTLNIKAGVGITLKDHSVKILGLKPTVAVDLHSGVLAEASGDVTEIEPMSQAALPTYEAIVIPQTISNGSELFRIINNGKTYIYSVKKETLFSTGTKYTFDITINANDLKVEMTGSVKDWETGDAITDDISI